MKRKSLYVGGLVLTTSLLLVGCSSGSEDSDRIYSIENDFNELIETDNESYVKHKSDMEPNSSSYYIEHYPIIETEEDSGVYIYDATDDSEEALGYNLTYYIHKSDEYWETYIEDLSFYDELGFETVDGEDVLTISGQFDNQYLTDMGVIGDDPVITYEFIDDKLILSDFSEFTDVSDEVDSIENEVQDSE